MEAIYLLVVRRADSDERYSSWWRVARIYGGHSGGIVRLGPWPAFLTVGDVHGRRARR